MFTEAIEKTIESVTNAQKSFVNQYFTEALKAPAEAVVEASRKYAVESVRLVEDYTTAMQRVARDTAKV